MANLVQPLTNQKPFQKFEENIYFFFGFLFRRIFGIKKLLQQSFMRVWKNVGLIVSYHNVSQYFVLRFGKSCVHHFFFSFGLLCYEIFCISFNEQFMKLNILPKKFIHLHFLGSSMNRYDLIFIFKKFMRPYGLKGCYSKRFFWRFLKLTFSDSP